MKTTFAIISALFAASTTLAAPAYASQAAPTVQTATVTFTNDQTGANVPIIAPLNGVPISVSYALINTVLGTSGAVLASSVQLTAIPPAVECDIVNASGTLIGSLTNQKTFIDLDGNPNAAIPINLDGFTLICEA